MWIARRMVVAIGPSEAFSRWLEPMMREYGGIRIAEPGGRAWVSSSDWVLRANR